MNTQKITVAANGDCTPYAIRVGRLNEYEVTEVQFDISAWQESLGDGTPNLLFKRYGDTNPYPVILTVEDNIATWTVTDTDTSAVGIGTAEIDYVGADSAFLAKSSPVAVNILSSLADAGDAPDPYESWLDTLTELASETQQNALAASDSADDAADSAADAEGSAEDAEAWAVGQRDGVDVSSSDETYNNNSKYYAEQAHMSEISMVFVSLEVDSNGDLIVYNSERLGSSQFALDYATGNITFTL